MIKMKRYHKGRMFEYTVRDRLTEEGWFVIRSAGSKGIADLVAIRPSRYPPHNPEVVLVQCSVGKKPTHQIKKFLDICNKLNVTPCLAVKGRKVPIIWFWGEESILKIYKKLKNL